MHQLDSKQPVWQMTRHLFILFNILTTRSTAADMYLFWEKNLYLPSDQPITMLELFVQCLSSARCGVFLPVAGGGFGSP